MIVTFHWWSPEGTKRSVRRGRVIGSTPDYSKLLVLPDGHPYPVLLNAAGVIERKENA